MQEEEEEAAADEEEAFAHLLCVETEPPSIWAAVVLFVARVCMLCKRAVILQLVVNFFLQMWLVCVTHFSSGVQTTQDCAKRTILDSLFLALHSSVLNWKSNHCTVHFSSSKENVYEFSSKTWQYLLGCLNEPGKYAYLYSCCKKFAKL